jgi:hypothetical protein
MVHVKCRIHNGQSKKGIAVTMPFFAAPPAGLEPATL